jgi:hypothetical protein
MLPEVDIPASEFRNAQPVNHAISVLPSVLTPGHSKYPQPLSLASTDAAAHIDAGSPLHCDDNNRIFPHSTSSSLLVSPSLSTSHFASGHWLASFKLYKKEKKRKKDSK